MKYSEKSSNTLTTRAKPDRSFCNHKVYYKVQDLPIYHALKKSGFAN